MGLRGASGVEQLLRRVLLPICAASGIVVVSGFFFPDYVGTVVSGRGWLVVSLFFFGAGLGYLAVLPTEDEAEPFDAEYLLRVRQLEPRAMIEGFLSRQDRATFGIPVAVFGLFFLAYLLVPSRTLSAVGAVQSIVLVELGWVFVGVMLLSVVYCLYLLVGPWGDVKLGGPDAEPTYTYPIYFTMFFTAGIAAGIVFWGPAEPLIHYQTPPPFFDVEPRSEEAVVASLAYALFHWGFSAWSAYIVVGVPIAYFVHQWGAPLRVSTVLTPFLGVENLDSNWCRLVDLSAIFATIGGIATSVAFVSQQFLSGISYQWGVTFDTLGSVLFVAGLMVIFVLSAQSGVHRGIRRIAAVNVVVFGLFAVLLVAVGPRSFMVERGTDAVGTYVVGFVPMSLSLGDPWVAEWTVWNWAWWFSWAPFAGLFLAALSRGRRIRTVVFTGFVATSVVTMVWFLLIGTTSLQLQHAGEADVLGAIGADGGEAAAGFPVFEALPVSELLMFLFLALIIVFMTTSADTSTLVVSVLATERGRSPTVGVIVFWGVFQGTVALSVLLTGSAEALQTAAVLTGGPFALVALVALVGLTWSFRRHERGHSSLPGKAWSALTGRDVEG